MDGDGLSEKHSTSLRVAVTSGTDCTVRRDIRSSAWSPARLSVTLTRRRRYIPNYWTQRNTSKDRK